MFYKYQVPPLPLLVYRCRLILSKMDEFWNVNFINRF